MAKNKMADVAKLLGVELEEEFKIKGFVNKCKLSTYGLMCWSDTSQDWVLSSAIGELLNGLDEIVKLPEQQEPILSKEEKEYLSAVIKPFRNKVISISKKSANYGEFIDIVIDEAEDIYLPYFKPGKMYQGIGVNREYTLEELGL